MKDGFSVTAQECRAAYECAPSMATAATSATTIASIGHEEEAPLPEPQVGNQDPQRHQEEGEQQYEENEEQDAEQQENEDAQEQQQEEEHHRHHEEEDEDREEKDEEHEREHIEDEEEVPLAAESIVGTAASMKQIHSVSSTLHPAARLHQAAANVIFDRCLAYLQEHTCTEGLFMLQPSLTRVRQLQQRILTGKTEAEGEEDGHEDEGEEGKGGGWDKEQVGSRRPSSPVSSSPHEMATLLLQHLQVRPQPIIPSSLYSSLLVCWRRVGEAETGEEDNGGQGERSTTSAIYPGARAGPSAIGSPGKPGQQAGPSAIASPGKPGQQAEPSAIASPGKPGQQQLSVIAPSQAAPVPGSATSHSSVPPDTVAEEEEEGRKAGEEEKGGREEKGHHVLRIFVEAGGENDDEDQDLMENRKAEEDESRRRRGHSPSSCSPPAAALTIPSSPPSSCASVSLPLLARTLAQLPDHEWKQLESLLFLLRRVATSPTGAGGCLHNPTTAALGSVVGPLLSRPAGSAHLSIRHAKDLPVLASLGAALIQHAPELLVPRGKENEEEEDEEEDGEGEILPPSSPSVILPLKSSISPCRSLPVQHCSQSSRPSTPPSPAATVCLQTTRSNTFPSPSWGPAVASILGVAAAGHLDMQQQHHGQQYLQQFHHHHHQQHQLRQVQVARLVLHEQLMPVLTSKLFSAHKEDLLSLGPGLICCLPAAAVVKSLSPCGVPHPQCLPSSSCPIAIPSSFSPSSSSSSSSPTACLPAAYSTSFLSSPPSVPALFRTPLHDPTPQSSFLPLSLPSTSLPRADLLQGCQALRGKIANFEVGFKRKHGGRLPKGEERLSMASTYELYRLWKRVIRERAARVLQRMVRRWQARGRRRVSVEGGSTAGPANAAAASLLPSTPPVSNVGIVSKTGNSIFAAKVETTSSSSPAAKQKRSFSLSLPSSLPDSPRPSPELQALLEEKKAIKRRLKNFNASFEAKHGRAPSKQEKEPVRSVYEKYNRLKGRIAALEQKDEKKEALLPRGWEGKSSSSSRISSLTRPTLASASRARMTAARRGVEKEEGDIGLPPQSPRRSGSPASSLSLFFTHDQSKSLTRTSTMRISGSSNSATDISASTSPRSPIAAASSAAWAFPSHVVSTPPLLPSSSSGSSDRTLHHLHLAHLAQLPNSDESLAGSESRTARPSKPSTYGLSGVSCERSGMHTALSSSFPLSALRPTSDVDLLIWEKKALHARLRKFERAFQTKYGRRVQTAGDILPVDEEYTRYKRIKAQLAQLGVVGRKEKGQGKASRGNK